MVVLLEIETRRKHLLLLLLRLVLLLLMLLVSRGLDVARIRVAIVEGAALVPAAVQHLKLAGIARFVEGVIAIIEPRPLVASTREAIIVIVAVLALLGRQWNLAHNRLVCAARTTLPSIPACATTKQSPRPWRGSIVVQRRTKELVGLVVVRVAILGEEVVVARREELVVSVAVGR